jgi:hypothetical protein
LSKYRIISILIIAIISIMIIMSITPIEEQIKTKEVTIMTEITYGGDSFWSMFALQNGLPICTYRYTGDMIKDFSAFTIGQGGGKSDDPSDPAAHAVGAFWPTRDKDGRRYHTVHDITRPFFIKYAPMVGIHATAENFYGMTVEHHDSICKAWIDSTKETTSEICNLVLDFAEWGSGPGGRKALIAAFHNRNGNISEFASNSEYEAFLVLLLLRKEWMMKIPDRLYLNGVLVNSSTCKFLPLTNDMKLQGYSKRGGWPTFGVGWSSGLAHFHRVFKHYCKN